MNTNEDVQNQTTEFAPLRQHAEAVLDSQSSDLKMFSEEAQALVHKLQVRQRELEMQNEALWHSQARLDAIISTATDAIITIEADQRIMLFNAAAEQMFGYPAAEVIGWPLDLLLPECFRQQHTRHVDYFGQTGITARSMGQPGELYGRQADGREFPIEVMISMVEASGQKFYTAIVRDITTRKQAEAEIEHSRHWLERIAHTTPDIIFVLDIVNNRNVYTNRSIQEILGYSPEEFGQLPDILQKAIAPDDLIEVEEFYRNLADAKPGQVRFLTHRTLHKNGTIRWIENQVAPFTWDKNGNLREVIGLARDVTERKQMELEKAQLFEEVNEQRDQLRALTKRLAEIQETERKELARELHDHLGRNLTALDLNLNIVQTLLPEATSQSASLQARLDDSLQLVGHMAHDIRDLMANLRPPVLDDLDDYGLVAALRGYGAELAPRVPFKIVVQGERLASRLSAEVELALFRIAQEALNNVSKHAQANQVTITVAEVEDVVHLVICDDGLGFDHNYRIEPVERQRWGLITMAERAEIAGATCRVVSAPGQGTQVIVEVARTSS